MIDGVHYQQAYVTPDVDEAIARMSAVAEVRDVLRFETATEVMTAGGPAEMVNTIGLLWIGATQYEFIRPHADPAGIYGSVDEDGPLLRFHHAAYRVAEWEPFRARVAELPFPVVIARNEGELRFLYLDTRALLGHHLEYVCATDTAWRRQGGR